MRPVGSAGLMFSSVRAITLPDTVITLSSFDGFGGLERVRVGREHALRHAVVIAQIDEQQIAVVALAMHPAGNPDLLSDVLGAELVVLVRAVLVACRSRILKRLTSGAHPPLAEDRPLVLRARVALVA